MNLTQEAVLRPPSQDVLPGPAGGGGLSEPGDDGLAAAESEAAGPGEAKGDAGLGAPPALADARATTSDDQMALLDELISLTLPDPPPVLTDEEALLHTASDLPLVMNEHVQRLINYFTKSRRGMATIRVSMSRGSAYRNMIRRILEEEGVPAELFYLAMAESGFRPKARSHAAATGMWQFISSRGKQYGLKQDRYLDLRYEPETATRAAARHLKDLHVEFQDWYLAMAAYNCGPNRVKSAIRRTGSRDYWTLLRRRALPRETRNYVPIILAMVYVGENLDLFGLEPVDPAPEHQYDTVRTTGETSFALIADATDSSVETIRSLNEALYRSATPPYGYDLRLPPGTGEQFQREIASVPEDKRLHWRRYQLSEGETLTAVAHRFKVTTETLLSINSLPADPALPAGSRLTVPSNTRLAIYRGYGGRAGGLLESGTGRYRIASGDTLGGIARRFGTTVSSLLAWNGLSSTRIRAGRYLIVKPEGTSAASASPTRRTASSTPSPTGRYRVRPGDSLSKIGSRFGVSVSQLRSWNGIRGSTIRVGQTLRVPASAGSIQSGGVSSGAYTVRSGDSLDKIAKRHGITVQQLRAWNGLRGTMIHPGQKVAVRPPSNATTAAPAQATASSTYVVRRGDTLGGIAARHGVTVASLRRWNNLRSTRIFPGQSLSVSASRGS